MKQQAFYINYYQARNNPLGPITSSISPTLELAVAQKMQCDYSQNQVKKCIARIRVTPLCVEGQFDE